MRSGLSAFFLFSMLIPYAASAKTIGVSITSDGDPFLMRIVDGLKKRATEKGLSLKFTDPKAGVANQIDDLKSLVAEPIDALIVRPADSDSGKAITQIATGAHLPVVYVNSQPVNMDALPPNEVFVGSDEKLSGTLETQEVCRLLGGKGQVVVMMGELFHPAARQRTQDVTDVIGTEACRGMTIVERQQANWSRVDAQALTAEWLKAGVHFDGVITNNDEMALGAIAGIKGAGLSPSKLVVAGIDGSPDALAAMKDGDLKVTVFQNAAGQGSAAVDATATLMAGGKVDTFVNVPFELVTPDNRDRFSARN